MMPLCCCSEAIEKRQAQHTMEMRFGNFHFSGPLRPGIVSPKLPIPAHIARPEYADTGRPISEESVRGSSKIQVWNEKSIAALRVVCKFCAELLQLAGSMCQPGVTTDQIDKAIHAATIDAGVYPSTMNYRGYPKSLCTSINEVICHGIPDDRPLVAGDIINCDISAFYQGFHGDCNATSTSARSTSVRGDSSSARASRSSRRSRLCDRV